ILSDSSRTSKTKELATCILAAIEAELEGRHLEAVNRIEKTLDDHQNAIEQMSARHRNKVIGSQCWYRLAAWDAKTRSDMFHVPFEKEAKSARYSECGRPALYLGNSAFLCWLECGEPRPLEKCRVSRFEIDPPDAAFMDMPATHSTYLD